MLPSFGVPLLMKKTGSLFSGVLFYLTMDALNLSSGIKLRDSVTNTWGGSVSNGITVVPGHINNALSFASDNFYIKQVSALSDFYNTHLPNSGWTIGGWLKLKSNSAPWFGNTNAGVFNDGANRGLGFYYPTQNLYIEGHTGSAGASIPLPLNTWTHVIMRFDGTNLQLYQNGSLVASTAATFSPGFTFSQIGNFSNYYQFNGDIDEVIVYNRAISVSEIAQLYNGGAGTPYPTELASPLLAGLQRFYPLNGSGAEVVTGQNGTATNVTWPAGKVGAASAEFANLSRTFVAPGLNLMTDISIQAWMYIMSNAGAYGAYSPLVAHMIGAGGVNTNWAFIENGYSQWAMMGSGNSFGSANTGSLALDRWHHLVATRTTGGTINIYVNGVLTASSPSSGAVPFSVPAGDFLIGTRLDAYSSFPGRVEQVGVWSRILSAQEVSDLYNGGIGIPYPFTPVHPLTIGLERYYKFDGNTNDASPAGRNATATNMSYQGGKINNGIYGTVPASGLTLASPLTNSQFSVSFWINPEAGVGGQASWAQYGAIVGQDSSNAVYLYQPTFGGDISLQLWVGNGLRTTNIIPAGAWSHVTLTATGSVMTMYINGTSVGTYSTTMAWTLQYLSSLASNTYPVKATIDEVGIWSRALTNTEIAALYNGGNGFAYPFS